MAISVTGAEPPIVLLTGFEPFGGAAINESWETVKKFQGAEIGGYRIQTALLPVVYDEMDAPLQNAIAKYKPAIVICFGVGTPEIHVETIARNGYYGAPDNKGKTPPRKEIIPEGSAEIKTALPAQKILAALKTAGIESAASTDAGGYLCNECFYRLMAMKAPPLRGFIHVPPYGAKFDAAKLEKAVRIIVATVIAENAN